MKDINKTIAIAIVSAQIASDAGKCIYDLKCKNQIRRRSEKFKYKVKTYYILHALNIIRKNKTDYNYYVSDIVGDQNNSPSIIVYFDFRIENKRYQMSFHTPLSQACELKSFSNTGRKTRWRRHFESSREAAQALIDYYHL
jgi:hypothetical protein